MSKREEELMKVLMQASVELIQTYGSGLSVHSIEIRMRRIASDLIDVAEEI